MDDILISEVNCYKLMSHLNGTVHVQSGCTKCQGNPRQQLRSPTLNLVDNLLICQLFICNIMKLRWDFIPKSI